MAFKSVDAGVALFGLVLTGALLNFIPSMAGAPLALVLCGIVYIASQEIARVTTFRGSALSESFATSCSTLTIGFLYFFGVNGSDMVLFVVTIALMFGSLVLVVTFFSSLLKQHIRGLIDFLATALLHCGIAAALGCLMLVAKQEIWLGLATVLAAAVHWLVCGAIQKPTRGREADTGHARTPRLLIGAAATFVLLLAAGAIAGKLSLPVAVLGGIGAGLANLLYPVAFQLPAKKTLQELQVLPLHGRLIERLPALVMMPPFILLALKL